MTQHDSVRDGGAGDARSGREVPLLEAVGILERRAEYVTACWVDRIREALYRDRPDLDAAALRDHGPNLVHSMAEMMRQERRERQPEGAPWLVPAANHVRTRMAQGIAVRQMMAEYQILREEAWRALQRELTVPNELEMMTVVERLHLAMDALGGMAGMTYGDEVERLAQGEERERKRLEAVLQSMPSGVIIAEPPSGQISLLNPQAARILHLPFLPRLSVESFEAWRVLRPDGQPCRPEKMPIMRSLREGQEAIGEVLEISRDDGTRSIVQISSSPIYDREGRVVSAVAIFDDITEREEAKRRLQESETRFRDLVEVTSDWVWKIDADYTYAYAGPQVRDLLGYAPEQVLGRSVFDFMLPDEARRLEGIAGGIVAEHRPFHGLEWRALRSDGREVILESSGVPYYDADGRFSGYHGIDRDVTERKRVEEERSRLLAELQRRTIELDATFDSIADGLVIFQPTGEVDRVNLAVEQLAGVTEAEHREAWIRAARKLNMSTVEGKPFPPEETPGPRALRGETVHNVPLVLTRPDGSTIWVSASAAPIRDPEGKLLGAVAVFRDITVQHELEEERDDLVRAVSHDLRSPLTVILAQAQLLLRRLEQAGLTGRERESAEAIVTGARRMNTMIQDLVDAARREAGQLELALAPVELRGFVLDLKRRLADVLEMGRVEVDAPEGLPPAQADADRLERIFINLLSNALKYSTPGTPVTVAIRHRDGQLVTSITDRGPGIRPEDMPHLFQRYRRMRRERERREGLGLGLYITRQLVEAHGGQVWAESQLGVGSTFTFTLPVAGPAAAEAPAGGQAGASAGG